MNRRHVQQQDCLAHSARHFQPEFLIRFECIRARQGMIDPLPHDRSGFYKALEFFTSESESLANTFLSPFYGRTCRGGSNPTLHNFVGYGHRVRSGSFQLAKSDRKWSLQKGQNLVHEIPATLISFLAPCHCFIPKLDVNLQEMNRQQVQQKDCLVLCTRYFQLEPLIRFECLNARQGMIPPPPMTEVDFTSPSNLPGGRESWANAFLSSFDGPNVPGRIPSGTSYIVGYGHRVWLFSVGETELSRFIYLYFSGNISFLKVNIQPRRE
ncbi:hypothetical protein CDAR_88981 [Caerostris darwini]|uniref:Uncharacterized protein n=1 Tax=Caerostris darwini TaxID=1538125 RepID=A0AAV4UZL0_9ARAC|nr:hypothetical protein CDAR_88981 [Caerostris darwini]